MHFFSIILETKMPKNIAKALKNKNQSHFENKLRCLKDFELITISQNALAYKQTKGTVQVFDVMKFNDPIKRRGKRYYVLNWELLMHPRPINFEIINLLLLLCCCKFEIRNSEIEVVREYKFVHKKNCLV